MTEIAPLPAAGAVFFDERDDGRTLRLSWHEDTATFVVSLWRGNSCVGSCRLAAADAPRFIHSMTTALAANAGAHAQRAAG